LCPERSALERTATGGDAAVPPTCPVSNSNDVQLLCEVNGFRIWRCPTSATDFVWPMPADETLKELYDREAWFEGGERGGYQSYDAQTEPSIPLVTSILDRFASHGPGLSVLDVGCGYGTHLRLAADRGWKAFGIEPSAHARRIARERHGERIAVVETAEELIPHRFALVLMLDLIEHLTDPYAAFFRLFSKGAIGPDTLVVLSTPNARSADAVADPAKWAYRHPPSHLVYYSAESLQILLRRLGFTHVSTSGAYRLPSAQPARFDDEQSPQNDGLSQFAGVVCEARGSNFMEFMHERYVPGTWSKLTEYEHLPRYAFAKEFAVGANVLDFGCGTGYGAAALAGVADSVLGLDIDPPAIRWARDAHRNPRLRFEQRLDLGRGLSPQSFDLVTCFEMIEHAEHDIQIATIHSIARLLKPDGKLIISTPNPHVTVHYGENRYHLREMNEDEFLELLRPFFSHVLMLRQWVCPSVLISEGPIPPPTQASFSSITGAPASAPPLAFVAVCSNEPLPPVTSLCQFDTSVDFAREAAETERKLQTLGSENYTLSQRPTELAALNQELLARKAEIAAIRNSRTFKLASAIRSALLPLRKVASLLQRSDTP
jgi:2-polyprenyl-3-methyl-5-hydroxy-6-metoxy-1,4-benzoquinol methylase